MPQRRTIMARPLFRCLGLGIIAGLLLPARAWADSQTAPEARVSPSPNQETDVPGKTESAAASRLIRYAKIDTQSMETENEEVPSTGKQFDLARLLSEEMREMGVKDVQLDEEHCFVYGFIPATEGLEERDCIAFLAHMDTSPQSSGKDVQPRIIRDYDGGDIQLENSDVVISPDDYPHLKNKIGKTLIVTDGTTLLGGDDKAGIAIIMDTCERVIREKIPHGRIAVCFTPDEEIGAGINYINLDLLNADFGYTVDGSKPDTISDETFNAAKAEWKIQGRDCHAGDAKGIMKNAYKIAADIISMLPAAEAPEYTEDREGFYHINQAEGTVESVKMTILIRDHDQELFQNRKNLMRHMEELINEKYGAGTAELTLSDSYYNMGMVLDEAPKARTLAKEAILALGITPEMEAARGGTDGSVLSFRGLPCPNLGTGAYAYHTVREHVCVEEMELMTQILQNIIELNSGREVQ